MLEEEKAGEHVEYAAQRREEAQGTHDVMENRQQLQVFVVPGSGRIWHGWRIHVRKPNIAPVRCEQLLSLGF